MAVDAGVMKKVDGGVGGPTREELLVWRAEVAAVVGLL